MECLVPEEQILKRGRLPEFDFHCPLLSLPLAFRTTLNSIPYPKPYLYAKSDRLICERTLANQTELVWF